MRHRAGFTLIELLVVIAIIAVLMAILMPGLQRVKEQARFTRCKANLRNYGYAARMYSDDNDGEFPYSFEWLYNQGGVNCNWHDASNNLDRHPELAGVMWDYLKGLDIHLCPAFDTVARRMGCERCGGDPIPVEPQYGYTMNSYLNGDAWNSVPSQYRAKINDLRLESQVVLLCRGELLVDSRPEPRRHQRQQPAVHAELPDRLLRDVPQGAQRRSRQGPVQRGIRRRPRRDGFGLPARQHVRAELARRRHTPALVIAGPGAQHIFCSPSKGGMSLRWGYNADCEEFVRGMSS